MSVKERHLNSGLNSYSEFHVLYSFLDLFVTCRDGGAADIQDQSS